MKKNQDLLEAISARLEQVEIDIKTMKDLLERFRLKECLDDAKVQVLKQT